MFPTTNKRPTTSLPEEILIRSSSSFRAPSGSERSRESWNFNFDYERKSLIRFQKDIATYNYNDVQRQRRNRNFKPSLVAPVEESTFEPIDLSSSEDSFVVCDDHPSSSSTVKLNAFNRPLYNDYEVDRLSINSVNMYTHSYNHRPRSASMMFLSSASSFNPMVLLLGKVSDESLSRVKKRFENQKRKENVQCASDDIRIHEPMMPGCEASEEKRQDFHCYLKQSGFLGAASTMALRAYSANVLPNVETLTELAAEGLGYLPTAYDEIKEKKEDIDFLNMKIQAIAAENDDMRRRLDEYETSETSADYMDPDIFNPILRQMMIPKTAMRKEEGKSEIESESGKKELQQPPSTSAAVTKILKRREHRVKPKSILQHVQIKKSCSGEKESIAPSWMALDSSGSRSNSNSRALSKAIHAIDDLEEMYKKSSKKLEAFYFS